MRKKIVIIAATILLAISVIAVVGCKAKEWEIEVRDDIIFWDEVKGAEKYIIDINGNTFESQTNSFDAFSVFDEYREYNILVIAVREGRELKRRGISYYLPMPEGLEIKEVNKGVFGLYAPEPTQVKGKLIMPIKIEEKEIKKIAYKGFSGCENLTGLLCKDAISISDYLFSGCAGLRKAEFRNSAEDFFAYSAFYGCEKLEEVILSDGVKKIDTKAFEGCVALRKIPLDKNMYIGNAAFKNCVSLKEIKLSDKLENIGSEAFYGCCGLSSVEIPKGVKTIGTEVFGNCAELMSLGVEEGNEKYRSENNCIIEKGVEKIVAACNGSLIPTSVKIIGEKAFSGCTFDKITVPGNVKRLENFSFTKCGELQELKLSEGIEILGSEKGTISCIIYFCDKIEEIEIPTSVNEIKNGAISSGKSLKKVTVKADNKNYRSENNCIIRKSDNELICGCGASEIPKGIKIIGENSFSYSALKEIFIPQGVERIGNCAFWNSFLTKVELPKGLKIISDEAFYGCNNMEKVIIPSGVEYIGHLAFTGVKIRNVIICGEVKQISVGAFDTSRENEKAKIRPNPLNVILPDNIEIIDISAFCYADIYTSATEEWPFHTADDWDYLSKEVKNCVFGYDEGIPYVDSVVYNTEGNKTLVGERRKLYGDEYLIPYREGYTFEGWSLKKDGEIIVGKHTGKRMTIDGDYNEGEETVYLTFKAEDISDIPSGAVLYAVWTKNNL